MRVKLRLLLGALPALLSLAVADRDLSAEYPFTVNLLERGDDRYDLYWNFDTEQKIIAFAVRVKTTGWVGFGLSPNGGMPNSDVVIGWVDDNGQGFLNDRYALERARPPVDPQQDWFLVNAKEENGETILEFTRNFTTCDPDDRDVEVSLGVPLTPLGWLPYIPYEVAPDVPPLVGLCYIPARVIFSWNDDDPVDNDPGSVLYHGLEHRGTKAINLLTGFTEPRPDPPGISSFTLAVTDVVIPNDTDTTYWCHAQRLPEEVRTNEQYIFEVAPRITDHPFEYVHHVLIYLCLQGLDPEDIDDSGVCFTEVGESVHLCTGSELIAAWALGGQDFLFPEDVALPLGGPGAPNYVVMEMHYDNIALDSGVIDNSGFEFFYTSTPPVHQAGILWVGHHVTDLMVIPPRSENYRIIGKCTQECTESFFPETGIKVFASFLHTHLIGTGVTTKVIRNTQQCGGNEELAPIDQNLQYDFNFQQATYLPEEITLYAGDTVLVECDYSSTSHSEFTFGGLSTREEMCLTFMYYYPRTDIGRCVSFPTDLEAVFSSFILNYVPSEQQLQFLNVNSTEEAYQLLNALEWTTEQVEGLEQLVQSSSVSAFCRHATDPSRFIGLFDGPLPEVKCDYQAPDVCTRGTPPMTPSTEGAPPMTPVNLLLVVAAAIIAAVVSTMWA